MRVPDDIVEDLRKPASRDYGTVIGAVMFERSLRLNFDLNRVSQSVKALSQPFDVVYTSDAQAWWLILRQGTSRRYQGRNTQLHRQNLNTALRSCAAVNDRAL